VFLGNRALDLSFLYLGKASVPFEPMKRRQEEFTQRARRALRAGRRERMGAEELGMRRSVGMGRSAERTNLFEMAAKQIVKGWVGILTRAASGGCTEGHGNFARGFEESRKTERRNKEQAVTVQLLGT
jgi:hypothetical protein